MAEPDDRRPRMPVDSLVVLWRPGSRGDGWTWLDETADLITVDGPSFGGLINSIRESGILEPVMLGNDRRVWDGHHRICAALIIDRKMLVPYELAGAWPSDRHHEDDEEADHG